MAVASKLALLALAVAVLTAPMVADTAVSCGQVSSQLAPCIPYLTGGGQVPPPCCGGVKAINAAAATTPDRQAACRCLQQAAKGMASIRPDLAAGLPGKCGVNIPYPISQSTDCNSVK